MDEAALRRSMMRITHEIIEKNNGTGDVVLLGIRRRGIPLAQMLLDNFSRLGEKGIPPVSGITSTISHISAILFVF